MTTKHFYIFRHGETDLNVAGRFQGQSCNQSLNAKGIVQAEELAANLKNKGLEVLISSPLKRALETAQIVAEKLKIPCQTDYHFIEGNFGNAEGKTKAELTPEELAIFMKWRLLYDEYLDLNFENGETKREIMDRALKGIAELAHSTPYKAIGISTHSSVIRMIMHKLNIKQQNVPNGHPFHLIYENGELRLENNAKFLLLSCCAPCSCAVIKKLAEEGKNFAVVFYNPNIRPYEEYEKRRDENKRLCDLFQVPFIELDYEHEKWCQLTAGLENEPERGSRCSICFYMRLKKVMEYARKNGYYAVASVLGVSRYKNLDQVKEMTVEAAWETACAYLDIEGRKNGMQELRQQLIKELKLYNQTYCGCKPR